MLCPLHLSSQSLPLNVYKALQGCACVLLCRAAHEHAFTFVNVSADMGQASKR